MKFIFRHTNFKGNGIVGLGSWLIRKIDKPILPSGFVSDHVAFYNPITKEIIESNRKYGVRITGLHKWIEELEGGFTYEITDIHPTPNPNKFSRFTDLLGTDYDYFSLVWQWIKIKTGIWIGKVNNAYNALVCSEFIAYILGHPKAYKMSVKDIIKEYVKK